MHVNAAAAAAAAACFALSTCPEQRPQSREMQSPSRLVKCAIPTDLLTLPLALPFSPLARLEITDSRA